MLDAGRDARFAENPLIVGTPRLRFYAAVPLVTTEGSASGRWRSSTITRACSTINRRLPWSVGRQVMALLDLRRQVQVLNLTLNDRVRAEESARWQAGHDPLTGLPNRLLFLRRVDEALAAYATPGSGGGTPIASLPAVAPIGVWTTRRPSGRGRAAFGRSIAAWSLGEAKPLGAVRGLDRFKRINDTLGHTAGDILLREIAARFSGCLRPEDTLARLGGDELTVLLPDVPAAGYAASVSQMLLRTLRRPVVLGNQELYVGASIGISTFPRDGDDAQTLLKNADIAMYQAKAKGGYQSYSRRMNADGYQRLIEEGELRRAIEKDELSVVYQPQVSVANGEIQGVEALARWRHPERGPVPAAHFIALAEQTDLIGALGEWVLRRVCRDAAAWRRVGLTELRVSVNLSARQLSQPQMAVTWSSRSCARTRFRQTFWIWS